MKFYLVLLYLCKFYMESLHDTFLGLEENSRGFKRGSRLHVIVNTNVSVEVKKQKYLMEDENCQFNSQITYIIYNPCKFLEYK